MALKDKKISARSPIPKRLEAVCYPAFGGPGAPPCLELITKRAVRDMDRPNEHFRAQLPVRRWRQMGNGGFVKGW